MKTIVVGVGNPVRSDDGAGLAVARLLRERRRSADEFEVAELWAGGLRLIEAMSGYDRAVVIDALSSGAVPAGTVVRLTPDDLGGARNLSCPHDSSLPAALETYRRLGQPLPEKIVLWGIEAQELVAFSEELTAPVAGAIPEAAHAILEELRAEGGTRDA